MSTQPLGAIVYRELDANGVPLAGGKLFTYAAGTTTPLATFTDSTGSVQNANPVILDAAGRADVWMTPGLLYKFVLQDSAGNLIRSEDNFPAPGGNSNTTLAAIDPGGRLTLTSGTPVTTADVTGATTIFYAPYKSIYVPVFDGTNWALQSIGAGISQTTADNTKSPAAVANNSNYDLFVWNDTVAGVIRLSRGFAWTSDTARGTGVGTTELIQQNGRWVNKNAITNGPGALLGLYVGTVRSDGSAQINDSKAKRHVWNMSNRVLRTMVRVEPNGSWTYTTAAFRQANASAANQLDYVVGLAEDNILCRLTGMFSNSTANVDAAIGIGVDSTTINSASISAEGCNPAVNKVVALSADFLGIPGLGRHTLVWLETSSSVGTTTWVGANGATQPTQSGLIGQLPA